MQLNCGDLYRQIARVDKTDLGIGLVFYVQGDFLMHSRGDIARDVSKMDSVTFAKCFAAEYIAPPEEIVPGKYELMKDCVHGKRGDTFEFSGNYPDSFRHFFAPYGPPRVKDVKEGDRYRLIALYNGMGTIGTVFVACSDGVSAEFNAFEDGKLTSSIAGLNDEQFQTVFERVTQ